jgi:uncharacterized protein YdaU (DUF1376 family)
MSRFPALPLFCDAWTLDTKHLTRAERGTYLDLLVLMWTTPQCRIPNDRKWIETRLGYPRGDKILAKIIAEFCTQQHRHWIVQKRLRKEFFYLAKKKNQFGSRPDNPLKNNDNANAPHPTPPINPLGPPLERGAHHSNKKNRRRKGNGKASRHDAIIEALAIRERERETEGD